MYLLQVIEFIEICKKIQLFLGWKLCSRLNGIFQNFRQFVKLFVEPNLAANFNKWTSTKLKV